MLVSPTASEIVTFWREAGSEKWFARGHEFDLTIRSRFLAAYEAAASGELAAWEENEEGALALVLLLDQFPRNMSRDDARAFATDAAARAVAAIGAENEREPQWKTDRGSWWDIGNRSRDS